ncbi:MAG TPA: hypothetical protein PKK43_14325 [Spirochaetota bacterium]|nr:hypothetical protein [Spirochaetota bacterium]
MKLYDANMRKFRQLNAEEKETAEKLYVQMSEAATLHRTDSGPLSLEIVMRNGQPSEISKKSLEAAIAESKKPNPEW